MACCPAVWCTLLSYQLAYCQYKFWYSCSIVVKHHATINVLFMQCKQRYFLYNRMFMARIQCVFIWSNPQYRWEQVGFKYLRNFMDIQYYVWRRYRPALTNDWVLSSASITQLLILCLYCLNWRFSVTGGIVEKVYPVGKGQSSENGRHYYHHKTRYVAWSVGYFTEIFWKLFEYTLALWAVGV